ncbi:sensor histidine kinase [Azospira restricta]|uniref:histidine kinase n=1 Tax=Azospira restricta TaxID=404405 RepID=A0A974PWU7_9RHOO|nr:ATP-binding protein [Azospira restricta]QRJ62405.1 sensor histidine kinase [Azospira restricta]
MQFHLVRYFTAASLGMFLLVAAALTYFEFQQGDFFRATQAKQADFFKEVQDGFARRQEEAARRDLLTIHESGNVNLTRLFANALWERDFAPFVEKAQAISVEPCHAIADVKDEKTGKTVAPAEKKACFAEVGKKIMALPGFRELDAKVVDSMKKSSVFKIKVFDLRGVTIYSSEHKQVGEDKLSNAGWRQARDGKPASELTHRDKFSAFEGVVENRDLISSYLPVLQPGGDRIVGVFEVYSDVTPFLAQIKDTSAQLKKTATDNQARVTQAADEAQAEAESSSTKTLAAVMLLLGILFAALFAIVRRADGIIRTQEKEREESMQQMAQAEKMASLGQMVAGVAHQLNTPLAFSHSNVSLAIGALQEFETPLSVAGRLANLVRANPDAESVPLDLVINHSRPAIEQIRVDGQAAKQVAEMLGDVIQGVDQMRELVDNLKDFTRLDRAKLSDVDINATLHTVVYIARSSIPVRVAINEEFDKALPAIECNPSQLNQVFLNLITNASQAIEGDGEVRVRTRANGNHVFVDVIDNGAGIPAEVLPNIFDTYYTTKPKGIGTGLGLPIARDIVRAHGGELTVETEVGKGTTFTVALPYSVPESGRA